MTAPATAPRIVSLNVGAVRSLDWHGRHVTTAIWKSPVAGRLLLRGVNFDGDDQADRRVHGGTNKAVYAYSVEDYAWWQEREGIETPHGLFGENLTTQGIDLSLAVAGERWRVGSVTLEVAQPRLPCFKLGIRMNDNEFPRRFQHAGRAGAYFRVIVEGDVGAGDDIVVSDVPAHGVTLRDMVEALHDSRQAERLHAIRDLPPFWREVAEGT